MRLRLHEVYGHVTLQDVGCQGWLAQGVAKAGPFDRESAGLANALVRNPVGTAVIEMGLGTIVFDAPEGGTLGIAGAEARLVVDGRPRDIPGRVVLRPGAIVELGVRFLGSRLYVAVPGGWDAKPCLGSVSGTPVNMRDTLHGAEGPATVDVRLAAGPESLEHRVVRVLRGPRCDAVPPIPWDGDWRVRAASDRVGVRLEGDAPPHAVELPSEPMCVGAVQATPAGGLLILGPDGPTVGGYPHVGTVIDADLDKVGQLRPRDVLSFAFVDAEAAAKASSERHQRMLRVRRQLMLRS